MDTAIINTWLLTFHGQGLGIVRDGAVGIEDDTIVYVGSTDECEYTSADIIIDGSDHVTMPGFVNAHTHTGLTLLRGCAQDLPEIEWMNRALGPLARHMHPKGKILGSQLGVLEGLRSGITTFSEYCTNIAEVITEVYRPFHVRVVATETINEVCGKGEKPTDLYELDPAKGEEALKRTEDLFNHYGDEEMISCLYGPQALDMISLETLSYVKERADERGSAIHMHVAQGERERLQIKGRYGNDATTVSVLYRYSMLDDHLIAVHIHDTTETERELMVNKGVRMVGCPSSIGMIDGIVPPLHHYRSLGGTVALGTDQAPGPGTHNMIREMRTASLLSKIHTQNPAVLPAWISLQLGTVGGAKVLGLEEQIGTLEEGKKADIITIDLCHPHLAPVITHPFKNFVPNLVYAVQGSEVDNVLINGQFILRDGAFTTIDEEKICKNANKKAAQIVERAEEDWRAANSSFVMYTEKGWL